MPTTQTQTRTSVATSARVVILAAGFLALMAQVAIPLPFTPVPITGQTFGVAMIALFLGRARALSAVALYLVAGAAGMPVFAQWQSGLVMGPTLGYLAGMFVGAGVTSTLADRGATRSFARAWMATAAGSVCVFAFGVWGLSFFVPRDQLFTLGVLPFLPGDLIKSVLAASMASTLRSKR